MARMACTSSSETNGTNAGERAISYTREFFVFVCSTSNAGSMFTLPRENRICSRRLTLELLDYLSELS